MKVLLALDVDGTLESSAGPVSFSRISELWQKGVQVIIVSPSSALGEFAIFPKIATGDRLANLQTAKHDYPEIDLYLYVSDNGDIDVAKATGFSYIDARSFL